MGVVPKLPNPKENIEGQVSLTPAEIELHKLFLEAQSGEPKIILVGGVKISFSEYGIDESQIPVSIKGFLEKVYPIVNQRYQQKFWEGMKVCLLFPKEKQEDAFKKLMTIFISPNSITLMKEFYEISGNNKDVENFLISMAKLNKKNIDKDVGPFASALQWWTSKNLRAGA